MTTTTTTKAFAWNKDTTKKAVALYQAKFEEIGFDVNLKENMQELTKAIGCPSFLSLRSKLSSEKAYQKADATATGKPASKAGKVTKIETCRIIATALNSDSKDALDSLAKANATDLATLAKLIEAAVAAAKAEDPAVEAAKAAAALAAIEAEKLAAKEKAEDQDDEDQDEEEEEEDQA